MTTISVIAVPLILLIGAILVIIIDAFAADSASKSYLLSIVILVAAIFVSASLWGQQGIAFNGMIVHDNFSLISGLLFSLAGLITILLAQSTPLGTSQFHSLLLLTLIGMMLLVSGSNLLVLFIGLEILSLSIYVLACFYKRDPLSAESGMKYFLLGSFASAFFLYGLAFIYGGTGTLQIHKIALTIANPDFRNRTLLLLGIIFLLVGYGFKISIAPFHMWTPDVYEGAPTPVTGFMAATVKAAALASLIRVFLVSFPAVSDFWIPIIWILSVLTMFAGNLAALMQNNLKRMLAYSSIAHAGYMLTGLLASPEQAQQTVLYYFATYIFMNLGAFTIVAYLDQTSNIVTVPQYQGLGYSRPLLATCMLVFLVSLGGLPPTAGFFGKFYLFRAVLQQGHVWLIVIAVINSAISFFYYLRVVYSMFTPVKQEAFVSPARISRALIFVLLITIGGTVSLGLFPNFFLELARAISLIS
jgi:NADH-quinone oxidoreductase subunit N